MDRNWMSANRLSKEYNDGVEYFVKFAVQRLGTSSNIKCPCLRCCYVHKVTDVQLAGHLKAYGIDQSYTCWTMHGEERGESSNMDNSNERCASDDREKYTFDDDDQLEEMTNAVEDDLNDNPEKFEKLISDAETPLYEGCTKFTKLLAVIKLYNLKTCHGWTDRSFTELLKLLKDMLPSDNVLPSRTYDAKKLLGTVGLNYEKIHACPNDCVLFRNEYASLKSCPKCNASRYKKKDSFPEKVLWYFPIIPRFRRMYRNSKDAKHLTWHEDERIKDGFLRHPADSPQWKKIDIDYPDFGEEPRNLRLALSADGFNPHGVQSSSHSTWPVILAIYNLPPWLCMKRKYMMLSLLISGPKQPGNDIDVYLAPLIEDLKLLWETGVEVYDGVREEFFTMRAMLFGTINDFPAYGNLSGYSTKGQCACPICEDNTDWMWLEHGRKNIYLGHRRFLPSTHRYRTWRKTFNGKIEDRKAPLPLTGEQLFEKVKDTNIKFGKPFAGELSKRGWKKKSIFFELPYWKSLYIRHFIDVMHVEKNVFESVIGTLLNIPGKTKDTINSRLDLVSMGLRPELSPIKKATRTYLPPAAHTLSKKEKTVFCKFLDGVKVPEGYSSNVRNLVSLKDLKLKSLKSHDCHVIMENFLPIGIRSILPNKVRQTLTKLCFFFKAICSRVIDPEKLPSLQREITLTLCELETYFPPSFFDIMIHLTVHLIRETQLCGPCYMRWMYPFERYMKILKGYVKNRSRPEGCIAERYIVEEAIEFCSGYLSSLQYSAGLPRSRHLGIITGGMTGQKIVMVSRKELDQAHLYVLNNDSEVDFYILKHIDILKSDHPTKSQVWLSKEHNRTFIMWLKNQIDFEFALNPSSISERLRWLAIGPNIHVLSYTSYLINENTFYTKSHDDQSKVQNSGVTLVAEQMHTSSAKDKNPIFANMSYFGIIEKIWELDYNMFREPVFQCKWVDNNNGLHLDESGFIRVNFNKLGSKEEPFILASQAQQVFYISDPVDINWSIVLLTNKQFVNDNDDEAPNDVGIEDDPFFGTSQSIIGESTSREEVVYLRKDHSDGITIRRKKSRKKKIVQQIISRKRKRYIFFTCLFFIFCLSICCFFIVAKTYIICFISGLMESPST